MPTTRFFGNCGGSTPIDIQVEREQEESLERLEILANSDEAKYASLFTPVGAREWVEEGRKNLNSRIIAKMDMTRPGIGSGGCCGEKSEFAEYRKAERLVKEEIRREEEQRKADLKMLKLKAHLKMQKEKRLSQK